MGATDIRESNQGKGNNQGKGVPLFVAWVLRWLRSLSLCEFRHHQGKGRSHRWEQPTSRQDQRQPFQEADTPRAKTFRLLICCGSLSLRGFRYHQGKAVPSLPLGSSLVAIPYTLRIPEAARRQRLSQQRQRSGMRATTAIRFVLCRWVSRWLWIPFTL